MLTRNQLAGTVSHELDKSVNNRIEHVMNICIRINCHRVQLVRLA